MNIFKTLFVDNTKNVFNTLKTILDFIRNRFYVKNIKKRFTVSSTIRRYSFLVTFMPIRIHHNRIGIFAKMDII